jgi:hypothetical protein
MYLKKYLDNAITVSLEYTENNACFDVRMKMGEGNTKKATITSGWSDAMKIYDIKKGAMYMFDFYIRRKGKIGLMIHIRLLNTMIHPNHPRHLTCLSSLSRQSSMC